MSRPPLPSTPDLVLTRFKLCELLVQRLTGVCQAGSRGESAAGSDPYYSLEEFIVFSTVRRHSTDARGLLIDQATHNRVLIFLIDELHSGVDVVLGDPLVPELTAQHSDRFLLVPASLLDPEPRELAVIKHAVALAAVDDFPDEFRSIVLFEQPLLEFRHRAWTVVNEALRPVDHRGESLLLLPIDELATAPLRPGFNCLPQRGNLLFPTARGIPGRCRMVGCIAFSNGRA